MTTTPVPKPAVFGVRRNGWTIVCHPAFLAQLFGLADDVARLRGLGGDDWLASPKAKLLARLVDIVLNEVPKEPGNKAFEQGNTLGAALRGWRRVKFLGRFRLFFRFDTRAKIIVYAWVNDENTLRKAGAKTDPYSVFRSMVVGGNPPQDWDALLTACAVLPGDPSLDRLAAVFAARPETVPATQVQATGQRSAGKKRR